jgi:hypothetical protein
MPAPIAAGQMTASGMPAIATPPPPPGADRKLSYKELLAMKKEGGQPPGVR